MSDNGYIDVEQIVEISELTDKLCTRLGLVPRLVRSFTITHDHLTAVVYQVDEHGAKYVDDEGEPATQTIEFKVVT